MAFGARSEQAVVTPLVLLLSSLPGLAVLPGPVLPFLLVLLLQSTITVGICGEVLCQCLEMLTAPSEYHSQRDTGRTRAGLLVHCPPSGGAVPAVPRKDPIAASCFRTTADNLFQLNNLRGFSAVLQLFISRINCDPNRCFQGTLPLCPCCHHGDHAPDAHSSSVLLRTGK